MANAYLLATTGEGDQVGKLGADAVELFLVTLDTPTQHPFTVVATQVISDPFGRTGVPVGREHPQIANLTVTGHIIQERLPPLRAKVLVVYKTDEAGGGSFNGWRVQSRLTTRTEHIGRSLPTLKPDGSVKSEGRLIGPHVYKPVKTVPIPEVLPDNEKETHVAMDPATGKEILLLGLGRTPLGEWLDDAPINVTGYDRIVTTMDYTLSRVAPAYSFSLSRSISFLGGRVNSVVWKGFPAFTLLFVGFTQDERVLDAGFEYPVTVELSHNSKGWSPIKFIETYKTSSGGESEVVQILGTGANILEEASFEVYETTDFESLFSIIGAGEPASKSRLRVGDWINPVERR